MAQGKLDLQVHGRAVLEAEATAYGGAANLVLLYKPLPFPSPAGYCYAPFAVVQLQDLPEQLRRQITGGGGQGAAAGAHRDEGAERHLLQVLRVAGVPEGLSRRLAAVASLPSDDPAVKFAGAFETDEGSMRAWMQQFGGGASIRRGADAEMGAFYGDDAPAPENAERIAALVLHKKNPADGEMDAFDGDGVPARENAALLLRKNKAADGDMGAFYITALPAPEYPDDGLFVFPGDEDDAVPLLVGRNRSAEQGSVYHYDSPTYAVQVSVDAAAGAKAGDPIPIAAGVKAAAGEDDAGHEHGNLSALVGIVAASSAATALAVGAVGPVMAFGLFTVLVGGLAMAMASVRAA